MARLFYRIRRCCGLVLAATLLAVAGNASAAALLRNEKKVAFGPRWQARVLYQRQVLLTNTDDMARYRELAVPGNTLYRTVDMVQAEIILPGGKKVKAVRGENKLLFPQEDLAGRLRFSYRLTMAEPEMPGVFFDSFSSERLLSAKDYYEIRFPRSMAFCWSAGAGTHYGFSDRFILPATAYGNPRIQVSTVCDWQQVKKAYRQLYEKKMESSPSGALAALAASWARLPGEKQLDAVLRYIRQQVKYQYAGKTVRRLAPRSPEKVLASGRGDCKDITALTVALLRRLHFAADPVLVADAASYNPDFPDPFIFIHAVIRVIIKGEIHCYDLTRPEKEECRFIQKEKFFFPLDNKKGKLFLGSDAA